MRWPNRSKPRSCCRNSRSRNRSSSAAGISTKWATPSRSRSWRERSSASPNMALRISTRARPLSGRLDPAYIKKRRDSIDRDHATPSDSIRPGRPAGSESGETTHFAVVDEQGNAVAVTYTLNGGYGSGVTVPGLGFLLNNEMDDFAAKPCEPNMFGLVQGEGNAIQPGKRPLSSMTPTIVLRDGQLFSVLGAHGRSRIPTDVLQVFLNIADFGMNAQDAVDFPRFHHQWTREKLYLEKGFSPDTVALLKARGHDVDYSPAVVIARVEAIVIDGGWLQGGSDGRAVSKAAGY